MIKCNHKIIAISQPEFYKIDEIITGYAFDIQNEIGRFCDEKIYQKILEEKCKKNNIRVEPEIEVLLKHKDFTKLYKIDLLVENSVIYELKAVKELNNYHKQQLINYLLITNLNHGKLLNFGSTLVESQFVSTNLSEKIRHKYLINTIEWQAVTERCEILKSILLDLLSDWGTFLECQLYNEALIHFLGGYDKIIDTIDIYYDNQYIGRQKMCLLDNRIIFHLSAITTAFKRYEQNIRRLIGHTDIEVVQWINFAKHEVKFKTIKK